MKGILILLFFLLTPTIAFANNPNEELQMQCSGVERNPSDATTDVMNDQDKEKQCRGAGIAMMYLLHRLDFCVDHQRVSKEEALRTKQWISEAYPKLGQEINSHSCLWMRTWMPNDGQPYDYSNGQNSELLTNTCESAIRFMRRVRYAKAWIPLTKTNWRKALQCWK